MTVGRRERGLRTPEAGHVDFKGYVERGTVVTLAVGIEQGREPVPPGMMWVEAPSLFGQSTAAFPVAGIGNEKTHVSDGESVHGVERDRSLSRTPKGREFPAEKQHRGQTVITIMIGGRSLDCAPRRRECTPEGIRQGVEPVGVLFAV